VNGPDASVIYQRVRSDAAHQPAKPRQGFKKEKPSDGFRGVF
jgi:hypothetical protein